MICGVHVLFVPGCVFQGGERRWNWDGTGANERKKSLSVIRSLSLSLLYVLSLSFLILFLLHFENLATLSPSLILIS